MRNQLLLLLPSHPSHPAPFAITFVVTEAPLSPLPPAVQARIFSGWDVQMKFSRPMADFVKGSCFTADNGNALADAGRLNLMDLGSGTE